MNDKLFASILEIVNTAIKLGTELISYALKIRESVKQSGELTPDQDKALDARIESLESQPWWKPEESTR